MPATPQDVLERVNELHSSVAWLSKLVIALLTLTVLKIFGNVVVDYRVTTLLRRVASLLELAERHGRLTDEKAAEIRDAATAATSLVVSKVESAARKIETTIPPKVVAEIERVKDEKAAGQSDTNLKTLPPTAKPN